MGAGVVTGTVVSGPELHHFSYPAALRRKTNYLRVYMSQIRAKLEPDSSHPRYFRTEFGMGHRFTP